MSLRPKYTLDREAVQGDRYTINAAAFNQLTSRRYPYPRIGTRAPNGMFPRGEESQFLQGNGLPLPTGHLAPKGIPGPLLPKFQLGDGNPGIGGSLVRMPYGYVEPGPIVKVGALKPHYMLNKTVVQGVMPASIYETMTGKRTTEFTLPPRAEATRVSAPTTPTAQVDYGSLFWGAVLGGVVTVGLVYGVIPALAEAGAKAIRKRA